MGLLILTILGAMLGWLAAIVLRDETRACLLCNLGAGVSGAVLTGMLVNSASVMSGLSAYALLAGTLGALLFIALVNMVRVNA